MHPTQGRLDEGLVRLLTRCPNPGELAKLMNLLSDDALHPPKAQVTEAMIDAGVHALSCSGIAFAPVEMSAYRAAVRAVLTEALAIAA